MSGVLKTDKELCLEKEINSIATLLDKLSATRRYATHDILKDMNVAEHSYRVAILAFVIGKHFKGVDEESLLKKALFHDMEESISGDILYTVKNRNKKTKTFFSKLEEDTVNVMFSDFDSELEFKELVLEAKDSSLEGRIIAIADMLEILLFLGREIKLGNKDWAFLRRVMAFLFELVDETEFSVLKTWITTFYNDLSFKYGKD